MNQKFPKHEKLKSSKIIERLFLEGKTISKFPIKVFFVLEKSDEISQAAFAVPKKNFKSAVDRNRIKRQLREAYRLNKQLLLEIDGRKFVMLFLFLGKIKPQYAELEKTMGRLIKELRDKEKLAP